MKKYKRKILPGVVVGIPVDSARLCLAKVLYSSEVFKDVILIGVSGELASLDESRAVDLAKVFSTSNYLGLIYTAATCVGDPWPVVGRVELREGDEQLTLRRVGGEVWESDRLLREASDSELRKLPNMGVEGCACAEDSVRSILKKRRLIS